MRERPWVQGEWLGISADEVKQMRTDNVIYISIGELNMSAFLILCAEVDPSVKDAFDARYENEHPPEALKGFNASGLKPGWSTVDPNVHIAL